MYMCKMPYYKIDQYVKTRVPIQTSVELINRPVIYVKNIPSMLINKYISNEAGREMISSLHEKVSDMITQVIHAYTDATIQTKSEHMAGISWHIPNEPGLSFAAK